jgi:hypothetical protein
MLRREGSRDIFNGQDHFKVDGLTGTAEILTEIAPVKRSTGETHLQSWALCLVPNQDATTQTVTRLATVLHVMRSLICQELASSAWDEKDMKRSALSSSPSTPIR